MGSKRGLQAAAGAHLTDAFEVRPFWEPEVGGTKLEANVKQKQKLHLDQVFFVCLFERVLVSTLSQEFLVCLLLGPI